MPVCQQDRSQNIFFVLLQNAPKMAHHLLPMCRLFIPPIPLGKISVAAHFLAAVVHSVVCYRVTLTKKKSNFSFKLAICVRHGRVLKH